jgi:hypothetical protein
MEKHKFIHVRNVYLYQGTEIFLVFQDEEVIYKAARGNLRQSTMLNFCSSAMSAVYIRKMGGCRRSITCF